jgi:hypothetical protein
MTVGWTYGNAEKICQDTCGELKSMVVACVLRYVFLERWTTDEVEAFTAAVRPYPAIAVDLDVAAGEHNELLSSAKSVEEVRTATT